MNLTNFVQCENDQSENLDHCVTFSDIVFECTADSFCNGVHAKINIPTINDNDKLVNSNKVN